MNQPNSQENQTLRAPGMARSLWSRLVSIGLDRPVARREIRHVKALNAICGVGAPALLIVMVLNLLLWVPVPRVLGIPVPLALGLPITAYFLLILRLNHQGRFTLARTLMLALGLLAAMSVGFQYSKTAIAAGLFGVGTTLVATPSHQRGLGVTFASGYFVLFFFGLLDFSPLGAYVPEAPTAVIITATMFGGLLFFAAAHGAREMKLAEDALERERDRADSILRNVLPDQIAERLKAGEARIADEFEEVSILFADVVDFTEFAKTRTAAEVVTTLDALFREFDVITERHGLEKIKTIGDAYMAAAGVPSPDNDHRSAAVETALAMHKVMERADGVFAGLHVRIGIHSGPVVAGVIGERKFLYDLWGDTVNTASRMESHGMRGEVQVTREFANKLGGVYELTPRGQIDVKGQGVMELFLVRNPNPAGP